MKSNELRTALNNLRIVRNHSYSKMDAASKAALDYTMASLEVGTLAAECEERKAELQSFKDYMSELLEWGMSSEQNQEKFYAMEIKIQFDQRVITLENCADAFNAIQDLLDEYINEL